MNNFAKRNFNFMLFLSTITGFVLPQFGEISGILILGVLSLIIFTSSFKVKFSVDFFKERAATIFLFYFLRFLALPVLLFYIILPFSPFYASCIFLLFVLPAGVTAALCWRELVTRASYAVSCHIHSPASLLSESGFTGFWD